MIKSSSFAYCYNPVNVAVSFCPISAHIKQLPNNLHHLFKYVFKMLSFNKKEYKGTRRRK